ncbi:gap junction alpha-4 protein [Pholidichthys leucotaenia]
MSRADWSFLEHLLEEGQEYSTAVGRVWLTVLFLFRILVLGTAAESAWDDEQADFVCNTLQPGCTAVCYDKAFPISHFRYFVLQVIFVSTPTIFYFGYVAIRAGKDKKIEGRDEKQTETGGAVGERRRGIASETAQEKEKEKSDRKDRKTDQNFSEAPKLKGRLLGAYAFSIFLKVLVEVAFIVGLWFLYDGFFIAPQFECTKKPCPHTVDCFVSRPTEKTIFTIYTQVIAAVSLLLNLIELVHLLQLAITHRLQKHYHTKRQDCLPQPIPVLASQETPELQIEAPQAFAAGSEINPPVPSQAICYSSPCESYRDVVIEVNWGSGQVEDDLLSSYINCMGQMRTTHSPKVHYKKHPQNSGKTTQKTHSKQKHYV